MKKLIYSICAGSLALAISAGAADTDTPKKVRGARNANTAGTTSVQTNNSQVNVHRNNGGARFQRRSYNNNVTNNSANIRHNRIHATTNSNLAVSGQQNVNTTRHLRRQAFENTELNHSANFSVNHNRNFDRNRRNFQVNGNNNTQFHRQHNVSINNNWRSSRFSGQNYVAFRNYHRQWHDRGWWSHHHSRIVFVFGGAYFWDAGYWYPAWGYNPGYNYVYDGPIYGYNNLAPDQVVVNVQAQLQREGYYSGPVDGQLGPMTRQAIADFQADRGLAITSAVDQPTLASLGLV